MHSAERGEDFPGRPVQTVAVVGMGTMGSGIAWLAARAGCQVRVVDITDERTEAGLDQLRRRVADAASAGLIESAQLRFLDAIAATSTIATAVRGAGLVIEAVAEDRNTKGEVLRAISEAEPSAVIGTNTSSIPIEELAVSVSDPALFLGVHFFNPAEWIPGVEVIPHDGTDDRSVQLVWEFLVRSGKAPALVSSSPGFIANRLQFVLFREAARCVEEGLATAESIDTVVRSTFGYRLSAYGPFEIADMAGLDVYENILDSLASRLGDHFEVPQMLRELVEAGRLGVKSGEGFRSYSDDKARELLANRDTVYAAIGRAVRRRDDKSTEELEGGASPGNNME